MLKNRGRPWGRLASFKGWNAKKSKSGPREESPPLLFFSSQGKMLFFVSASCVQFPEGVKNFHGQKHWNFKTIIPSELISWKLPPQEKLRGFHTSNKKNLGVKPKFFSSKQIAETTVWLEAKESAEALVGQKTYLCWTAAPQKFHFKVETWKSRAQPCENTPQSSSPSRTPQKKVLQWKDSQFANFILTLFSGKTSVPSTNYILNVLTDMGEWAGAKRWSQGLVAGSSAKKKYIYIYLDYIHTCIYISYIYIFPPTMVVLATCWGHVHFLSRTDCACTSPWKKWALKCTRNDDLHLYMQI